MIVGIDGEGVGRFPHRYVLLAASDATGDFYDSIENSDGLSSVECLSFLADLAYNNPDIVGFSYSFNYDITKILTDVPNSIIYRLVRPDERKWVKKSLRPVEEIFGDFRLNLFGSQFSVRRGKRNGKLSKEKGLVIWDVFKFFQGPFVKALEDWKIAEHDLDFLSEMKDARGQFEQQSFERVKTYCFQECRYLAQLVDKLTQAHAQAGLTLKSYHGAGSTAAALLDKFDVKSLTSREIQYSKETFKYLVYDLDMKSAVLRAFFGGRFENSVIGPVEQDIYSYDISSAYPYQIFQLPCLEHGLWRLTENRSELNNCRQALICFRNPELFAANNSQEELLTPSNELMWGPLPIRSPKGAILYPINGGVGFTYLKEFIQAEKLGIKFVFAWILDQDCDCQPFADIPTYYNERQKIGKDGPGIVLKLGINACYGKLAQSIGEAQYRSWLWAGMITSGCRAQLLEALHCHSDERNLLAVATDGVYSLEKLTLPRPIETGTGDYGKPLGGWEEKIIEGGMFFARPGVNFGLRDKKDVKLARGRGYGRRIIAKHADAIIQSYLSGNERHIFPEVSRFNGAKNTISVSKIDGDYSIFKRSPNYGEWTDEPMKLDFCPEPKRAKREGNRLLPWQINGPVLSAEYAKGAEETFGKIGKEQPE